MTHVEFDIFVSCSRFHNYMKHGTVFTTNDIKYILYINIKQMLIPLSRGGSQQYGLFAMYNIKFVIPDACIKLKETTWFETFCC